MTLNPDPESVDELINAFEHAVQDAAYSDSHPMGDPGNYYKHCERDEARKALLTEIARLKRTLVAVETAREIEHRARRSLQQSLKDLCAQHIGGELEGYPPPTAGEKP